VGRDAPIIDSSICVATMTGLACSRQACTARFCTSGTVSSGISTPEVAAGDHEPVERLDDLVEVVDRLRLLDLGEDGQAGARLVHDLVHALDVLGRAHERQRDHVGPQGQAEAQVVLVLLRQGGHADADAGQGQALVVRDRTALGDEQPHVGPSTSTTRRPTRPSSTSRRSPTETSPASPL
jgi:hypothetical protein